jgi:SecD/SecF fusion protein
VNRSTRIRGIFTFIIIVLSLWFLWPTYRLATMSKEDQQRLEVENPEKIDKLHKKALKLGLDLKGGMHLVLEVDDSQLKAEEKKDVLDRALEIVRNRVDQFGVSEPTIQKEGSKRIIVQLPGLQDPERAKRLIGQTAMLEWKLIRQQQEVADVLRKLDDTFKRVSGDSLVEINPMKGDTLGVVPDIAAAKTPSKKSTGKEPPKLSPFGKETPGESLFARTKGPGEGPLNVPLETVDKNKPFTSLLQSFYRDWVVVPEDNVPLVRRMLARPEAQLALPKDSEFMWFDQWMNFPEGGRGKALMLVANDEYVSGANLMSADPTNNPQSPTQLSVAFTFNRKGARELSRFTGENVGRFTAIILDGKIKSFPVIKSKIPDGRGVIEGTFTDTEARDLAIILRAGALPAPMFPREERTVGPSLGSDSIRQGLRAGLLGGGAVIVFMIIYYQLSGVIASLGVILTMVSLFGFLAYFGAALTLPGIAGLVLTIGMAVDANVLIYERIREELRRPIKGFATTLSIGILTSMFAACVFCRFIFDLWVSRPMKKLSI